MHYSQMEREDIMVHLWNAVAVKTYPITTKGNEPEQKNRFPAN